MRRYGRFSVSEGAVYREFDPSRDVVEPFDFPKEWQENVSIDPGLRNPLACLFFAVDWDGVIYVVGEWYEAGREVGYHADKIARAHRQRRRSAHIVGQQERRRTLF